MEQISKIKKRSHLQRRAKRLLYLSESNKIDPQNLLHYQIQLHSSSYMSTLTIISKVSEESVRQSIRQWNQNCLSSQELGKQHRFMFWHYKSFASLGANGPKSTKATPIARRIVVHTLVLPAMLAGCDSPWYEDCASCDSMASGLLH
jgi:formate dehydrogenase maturation protein FdhE